jgi:hypothetical protein
MVSRPQPANAAALYNGVTESMVNFAWKAAFEEKRERERER